MSKIKFKDQHGDSKFNLNVVTSGASETEIEVGRQYDRSSRDARIIDLPADIDLRLLAADLSRLLGPGSPAARELRDQEADLRAAEKAASDGDSSAVSKFLSKAGSCALEVAKKVGADVAAAAIKASLGLK